MNRLLRYCLFLSLCLPFFLGSTCAQAQKWTQPTPEELSMTEQKGAPDASAVYLYREEITDDNDGTFSFYNRIKILKDKGKNLARIQLHYNALSDGSSSEIQSFAARTIHADGTVLPMKDPPTEETLSKGPRSMAMRRIYNLPQPEVGSILEYRYTIHLNDYYDAHGEKTHRVETPEWDVQGSFYMRSAHYVWAVTNRRMTQTIPGAQKLAIDTISWSPVLPAGTTVKKITDWQGSLRTAFELNIHDVPPIPRERYQPPVSSFVYRVRFYYAAYSSSEVFWKESGARWSEAQNRFNAPGPGVKAAVSKLVTPTDTPEQKLKKLYAAAMELENTSVERGQGVPQTLPVTQAPLKSTDDVLAARRGSNDQINALFLAMVRAAGIKADLMRVANRSRSIFNPNYLTFAQLDDDITVVNLDGKELYLDPGTRFCPFGHLDWEHSVTTGLRQINGGTAIASTPGESIAAHQTLRVANLTMNEQGEATGTLKVTYLCTAATYLRQLAAVKGESALSDRLKETFKKTLPEGMSAEINSISKIKEYEEPLEVVANVKGNIGTQDGAHLSIKADLFQAQSEQLFKEETREQPVYFTLNEMVIDAIRINFPSSITIVSIPSGDAQKLKEGASYKLSTESTPTSVTIRRNYSLARRVYPVDEYPDVHAFYAKIADKDQEPIVLQHSTGVSESK